MTYKEQFKEIENLLNRIKIKSPINFSIKNYNVLLITFNITVVNLRFPEIAMKINIFYSN